MAKLFFNTLPEILAFELEQIKFLGLQPKILASLADLDEEFVQIVNNGTIKWVVSEESKLVIAPKWVETIEIAHSVLVEGKPILAAGEAEISGTPGQFYGISIDNYSGHYQPDKDSLELGKAFFERLGIRF